MKNKLYQTFIIKRFLYLIFLCFWSMACMSQPSATEKNVINNGTDNTKPLKRRRQSKQQRFRAQRESQQPKPGITTAPPTIESPAVIAKEDGDANTLKTVSVSQSELASVFQTQEDSEAHLLRGVSSLRPLGADDTTNTISVNLDKTELLNLLSWIESIFKVKFLSGDSVTPAVAGKVAGNLISYKTNKPMSKQQVWDLFLNFLDLFGLTLVATHYTDNYPDSYTIMPVDTANQAPLPAFVGIDWKSLPNNDTKIRYVYFVENGPAANLANLVQDFKSKTAIVQAFNALNAIIFTDKASNIRSLMAIISELDNVSMPEAMSVLRLKHANAEDVVNLYQNLVSTEDKGSVAARLFGAKKQPTAIYFPEDTQLFAEPRSNALIILGNREGISKVENFILDYVDTELKQPYSPLYVHKLEYANSDNMAAILSKVTNFAAGTPAAAYGGVRGGDKYFRPMTFISEPSGNKLLIKAEKDDYLRVKEIIKKLDVKQPQVAIEVLIVSVSIDKLKSLGIQLRNKRANTLGITDNIAFQTSGLGLSGNQTPIVVDANGGLMGNLVSLATNFNPGTTLISIGNSIVGGVWALFQALETYTFANVVSHPFLTTTNKYTAQVSVGETRRVATGTVTGAGPTQNTLGDVSANLSVAITPQINSNGIINLAIEISIDTFTSPNATDPTKNTQVIKTNSNLANNEILAIGGLIQDNISEVQTGVPLLQRIPLLGWFFKNRTKDKNKSNLVVFISPQIVQPRAQGGIGPYSEKKAFLAQDDMCAMHHCSEQRDPIHRWFFRDYPCENTEAIDDFINPNECNLIKGYNCRTGQEYSEESVGTDIARCCPPVICDNDYTPCDIHDHVTPLCEPHCPRPCQPVSPCPEEEYAPVSGPACCAPLCQNDEQKVVVDSAEPKKIMVASNQDNKQSQTKRLPLKRKQSVTDFLPENKEVIT
jgi:general secretion pathway protein D